MSYQRVETGFYMVTLNEAKNTVLLQAGAGKEEPDTPPLIVYKSDGRVADFFPPEHMTELPQMKLIEGDEE